MNEIKKLLLKESNSRGWNLKFDQSLPVEEGIDYKVKVYCPSEDVYLAVLRFTYANQIVHKVEPSFRVLEEKVTASAVSLIRKIWNDVDRKHIPRGWLRAAFEFMMENDPYPITLNEADRRRLKEDENDG